jgi:hypothetical protein
MYKEKSQNKKFARECGSRESQRARQQGCDDGARGTLCWGWHSGDCGVWRVALSLVW